MTAAEDSGGRFVANDAGQCKARTGKPCVKFKNCRWFLDGSGFPYIRPFSNRRLTFNLNTDMGQNP
jgi:hypothetical protein